MDTKHGLCVDLGLSSWYLNTQKCADWTGEGLEVHLAEVER